MPHEPALIATLAIGLTAALFAGLLARRIGLPAIVGYLFAGVAIGPFTPGVAADTAVALELAEIGVVLLMFGVGIEFSLRELAAVRATAVPGSLAHLALAALLGTALGMGLGWTPGEAVILGLAVAVASTVALVRALVDRHELDLVRGRVTVGWLIVEDLATVVILVVLPTIAPLLGGAVGDAASKSTLAVVIDLAITLGKVVLFVAIMVVAGRRFVPWLLDFVAHEGSRELFTLAVLAGAVGIAYTASAVFGVSLALGAFLAGAVISESDLSHQAEADVLPLRDAFAVLFFVSVGMLLDPTFLVSQPLPILAVVLLIVVGKPLTTFVVTGLLGYPALTGLTVAIGLAQVGEFSFIVGSLAVELHVLPVEGLQLLITGAIVSITLNPFLFRAIGPLSEAIAGRPRLAGWLSRGAGRLTALEPGEAETLHRHAILGGYGRVGRMLGGALERRGFRYAVITWDRGEVERARARGIPALYGDAASEELLERAGVADAQVVIAAMSDPRSARLIVERARGLNPRIQLVVRTHDDRDAAELRAMGGSIQVVHGGRELAVQMARYTLRRFGVTAAEAEAIAQGLRGHGERGATPT